MKNILAQTLYQTALAPQFQFWELSSCWGLVCRKIELPVNQSPN